MCPEINIVLMDNSFGVKGSVNLNSDGSYTIIINSKLSYEEQKEVCKHELLHILNQDFGECDVNEIEEKAHNLELLGGLCFS